MQPFTSQRFGNPSSVHTYGLATRAAVDKARQQVAALINCWADELAFTSCGTEADNWAIWGSVMARKDTVEGTPHVVTSAVEHPAVTKCLQQLQQLVSRAVVCFTPAWRWGQSCIFTPAVVLTALAAMLASRMVLRQPGKGASPAL
jgi:cysteine sulfinate desulfinase/cysteine desulfurase-like protein